MDTSFRVADVRTLVVAIDALLTQFALRGGVGGWQAVCMRPAPAPAELRHILGCGEGTFAHPPQGRFERVLHVRAPSHDRKHEMLPGAYGASLCQWDDTGRSAQKWHPGAPSAKCEDSMGGGNCIACSHRLPVKSERFQRIDFSCGWAYMVSCILARIWWLVTVPFAAPHAHSWCDVLPGVCRYTPTTLSDQEAKSNDPRAKPICWASCEEV